jgi:hypothetical protein
MEKYNLYITDRQTKEVTVLDSGLTEEKALKFCEEWGWMYTDENSKTFWLGYDKQ